MQAGAQHEQVTAQWVALSAFQNDFWDLEEKESSGNHDNVRSEQTNKTVPPIRHYLSQESVIGSKQTKQADKV